MKHLKERGKCSWEIAIISTNLMESMTIESEDPIIVYNNSPWFCSRIYIQCTAICNHGTHSSDMGGYGSLARMGWTEGACLCSLFP